MTVIKLVMELKENLRRRRDRQLVFVHLSTLVSVVCTICLIEVELVNNLVERKVNDLA